MKVEDWVLDLVLTPQMLEADRLATAPARTARTASGGSGGDGSDPGGLPGGENPWSSDRRGQGSPRAAAAKTAPRVASTLDGADEILLRCAPRIRLPAAGPPAVPASVLHSTG